MPRPKKSIAPKQGESAADEKIEQNLDNEQQKKRVRHSYIYAVGRRKRAIARVRLFKKGEGKITINEKDYNQYFVDPEFQKVVIQPLEAVNKLNEFNFSIKVAGGGIHGQAKACRHGIARALVIFDKDLKALEPFFI